MSRVSELVTSFSALERRLDLHSPTNVDGAAWATLHFAFHAHRAGVLVVLDDGAVELVPFVNARFDNRLALHGTRLRMVLPSGAEVGVAEYFSAKAAATGMPVEAFLPSLETWWFNGHVVCNVPAPPGAPLWSTRGLAELAAMLGAAAALPGAPRRARLVLNKRDAPLLDLDRGASGLPPLHPLWRGRAFLRPLSLYGGPRFADALLPAPEHWALAQASQAAQAEGAWAPWETRASRAVFRGTATGPGSTLADNQRLALAAWGLAHEDIADVALTALSLRDRAQWGPRAATVTFMDEHALRGRVRCAREMSPAAQAAAYKYQIYAAGHAASSRLAWLLLSGSLVIRVGAPPSVCAPDMWLTQALALRSGVHVLDVRADLADLEVAIRWAQTHDAQARAIADAGRAAAEALLQPQVLARAVATALCTATESVVVAT
jgi:hypothetical protein